LEKNEKPNTYYLNLNPVCSFGYGLDFYEANFLAAYFFATGGSPGDRGVSFTPRRDRIPF